VSRTAEVKDNISNRQFTEAYRAPFPFRRLVREHLGAGTFVLSPSGVALVDLVGDGFHYLTGRCFCLMARSMRKSPGRGDWFRAMRLLRQ
jgi:hypothetical protein